LSYTRNLWIVWQAGTAGGNQEVAGTYLGVAFKFAIGYLDCKDNPKSDEIWCCSLIE
jgi:hypothetical protein